jgi:hypothetical protein
MSDVYQRLAEHLDTLPQRYTTMPISLNEATSEGWPERKGGRDTNSKSVSRPVGANPTGPTLSRANR